MSLSNNNASNPSYTHFPPALFPIRKVRWSSGEWSTVNSNGQEWLGMDPLELLQTLANAAESREKAENNGEHMPLYYRSAKLSVHSIALPKSMGLMVPALEEEPPIDNDVGNLLQENFHQFSHAHGVTRLVSSPAVQNAPRVNRAHLIVPDLSSEDESGDAKSFTDDSTLDRIRPFTESHHRAKFERLEEKDNSRRVNLKPRIEHAMEDDDAPSFQDLMWNVTWLIQQDPVSPTCIRQMVLLATEHQAMPQAMNVRQSYLFVRDKLFNEACMIHSCSTLDKRAKRQFLDNLYFEIIQMLVALIEVTEKIGVTYEVDFGEYMPKWLRDHWINPFPDDDEIEQMSNDTGVSMKKVNNWLINARTRKWRPAINYAHRLNRPVAMLKDDAIAYWDSGKPRAVVNRRRARCQIQLDDATQFDDATEGPFAKKAKLDGAQEV